MKKVFLVAALALGSFATFAATPIVSNTNGIYMIQDEYQEIENYLKKKCRIY